jgi:2-polyprenyl-3-methyl-5-hydroxy-6-metoxy-1,4-benzoquinol methylase
MNNSHTSCTLCHSEKITHLRGYEKNHLSKCSNCGFVFCKKIPTQEELEKYYENYGSEHYLSPITISRYEELLDLFEKYRKNNTILDVGCGSGYFLEVAKKRGWQVYGTEFSDHQIKRCEEKGILMKQGEINADMFEREHFDIITSFEVLEHTNNPQQQIQQINKLLRQGGGLYLTTPNFNALYRFRLKGKYNVINYPEHLSYFTKKTLHRLFKSNGFKKLLLVSHGISVSRIKTSFGNKQDYISPVSDDEKIRAAFEKNKFKKMIKRLLNSLFNLFGVGDKLKAMYIKS